MARYTTVPINFVGGESKSRSKFWSSQSSVNLYVDKQSSGRSPSALLPWPGEKAWSTGTSGINRGMHVTSTGKIYVVLGNTLYKVDQFGAQTSIGSIDGSARCTFADDGTNVLIRITGSVSYINRQFILAGPGKTYIYNESTLEIISLPAISDSGWSVSDAGDPDSFTSVNVGSAEAMGDPLKQVFVHQQKVYLCGSKSIEPFYDSDVGSPSFTRIEQGVINTLGVASPWSMAATTAFIYFLGSDGVVYRINTFQPQSITPSSIAKEISDIDCTSAVGFTCSLHGANFYILQFSRDLTLAYSELSGEWSRLSSGTSLARHLMNGYGYAYEKHLVADTDSSDIYEWDFDTYQSNGSVIIRQRDTAPINGLSLGAPGKRLLMNKATFIMETGIGSSLSENPKIMVSASYDGGRSFTNEDWIEIGREGEAFRRIDWYNMASFYDLVLRVRVSDPVFTGFHGGSIDLKVAGI